MFNTYVVTLSFAVTQYVMDIVNYEGHFSDLEVNVDHNSPGWICIGSSMCMQTCQGVSDFDTYIRASVIRVWTLVEEQRTVYLEQLAEIEAFQTIINHLHTDICA